MITTKISTKLTIGCLNQPVSRLHLDRNPGWLVLQVVPGRERFVCNSADRYDFISYFPRIKKMIKPPKKRKPIFVETIHAVFPGYVFVLFHSSWKDLLKSEYAIKYLGETEIPYRVSDFDISQIQDLEEAGFISRNRGIVVGDMQVVKILGDITLPVESISKDSFFLSAGVFRIKIPLVSIG